MIGRKNELYLLNEAFNRVRDDNKAIKERRKRSNLSSSFQEKVGGWREIVLLSGSSGTGKTALAHKLKNPTKNLGGIFAYGKFEFQRCSEPYTAFNSAFGQICDDILRLKKTDVLKFEEIKHSVQKAVGPDCAMLAATIIPNINLIIGNNEKEEYHSMKKRHQQPHQEEDFSQHNTSYQISTEDGVSLKNKFNYLIRKFLRSVSRIMTPLVILIDDLQWADVSSIDLIQNILADDENSGFVLLCCYRDDEVDHHYPLLSKRIHEIENFASSEKWVKENKNSKTKSSVSYGRTLQQQNDDEVQKRTQTFGITKIHIGNLSVDSINLLLEEILSSNKDKISSLANIIHKRTHGNVFFVLEFLKSLKDNGLLTYNFGLMQWGWDEEQIKLETNVTQNVATLMSNKMSKALNEDEKEILSIAARLGSTFEVSTLVKVASKILIGRKKEEVNDSGSVDILNSINACINEGFLEEINVNSASGGGHKTINVESRGTSTTKSYRFIHDQIQQAALFLVSKRRQEQLRFHIGEILVVCLSAAEKEKNLFVAVNLLNSSITSTTKAINNHGTTNIGTFELAKLNLQAGKKAMKSSAFVTSSIYLRKGIELLGPNRWDEEKFSMLSIELFSVIAQVEYCNGNFDDMQKYIDEVLAQTHIPFEAKKAVYLTLLQSLRAQEKFLEGIETSLYLLSKLGVKLPKRNFKIATINQLIKTKMMLRGKSMESLLDLPILKRDNKKATAMIALDNLGIFAYMAKPELVPLVVFKVVQISVKYGMSHLSPPAFSAYSFVLCSLGDFRMGYEYGEFSMALLKRLGTRETESRVLFRFYGFVSHWTAPAAVSLKPHREGYLIGMETGDLEHAMLNAWSYLWCSLNSGHNLNALERDMRHFDKEMVYYKQEFVRSCCVIPWQLVLNLVGKSDGDPTLLTGEAMDQTELLDHFEKTGNTNLRDHVIMASMVSAFYFENYELAWSRVESARSYKKSNPGHPNVWRMMFFQGLTAFSLAHKKKSFRRRRLITQGMKIIKMMTKWVSRGNLNCVHIIHLLRAEKEYLKGQMGEAHNNYNEAIKAAARVGFTHDRALANERAGKFFLATGDENQASFHLGLAYQLYVEWGACAIADHLKKNFTEFLAG